MDRKLIEDKYDEFFGTGYWEREYKKHIVEFASQCSNSGKPIVIACKEFIGQLMIKLQYLAELQDRDFDRTVINHKIGDLYTAMKVINEYSAL